MTPPLAAPPWFRDTLPLLRFVQMIRESSIAAFMEKPLNRIISNASPRKRRQTEVAPALLAMVEQLESGQAWGLFLRNGTVSDHRRWLLQNKSALFLELSLVDLALGETLLQNRHGA